MFWLEIYSERRDFVWFPQVQWLRGLTSKTKREAEDEKKYAPNMATWVWSSQPRGSPFRIGQFPEDENGCWHLRNRGGGAPPRGTSSATKPIMTSGSICSSSGGVDMNQRSNCEAGDTFFAQNPQVFSYVKLFRGYCYNPRHVVVVRWFLLAGCFRKNIMWRTQNHGDVG